MVMEDSGSSMKVPHDSTGVDSKEAEQFRKREECKLIREKCFSPLQDKCIDNVALNSKIDAVVPSAQAIKLKYKNNLTKLDIQLIKAEISRLIDPYLTPDDRKRLDTVLQYAFKSFHLSIGPRGPRPFPSSQEIGASNVLFEPLRTSDTNITEKIIENKVTEMVKKIDKLTTPFLSEGTRKKLSKIIVSILSGDFMECDYDLSPFKNKGTLDTNLGTLHQDEFSKQEDTSSIEHNINILPPSQDNTVSDTGQSIILSEMQDNKAKHRYYLTDNSKQDTPVDTILKMTSPENRNVFFKPDLNSPIVEHQNTENSSSPISNFNITASEKHDSPADINANTTSTEPQISLNSLNKEPLENESTLPLLNIPPSEHQYSFPGLDTDMTSPSEEAFSPEIIQNKIVLCNEPSNITQDEKSYDSVKYTKEELDAKDNFIINNHLPSHIYTVKSFLTSQEDTSMLGQPLVRYNANMLLKGPVLNDLCKKDFAPDNYAPAVLTDKEINEILSEINKQISEYLPPHRILRLQAEIHRVLTVVANENASVYTKGNSFHNLPDNHKYLVENVDSCCTDPMNPLAKNENVGLYTNQQNSFHENNKLLTNADGNEFSHLNSRGEKFFDPDTGISMNSSRMDTYRNPDELYNANDDMSIERSYYNYHEEMGLTEEERILVYRQDLLYAIEKFLDEISPQGFKTSSIQERMEALRRQGKIEFVRDFLKNELCGLSDSYSPLSSAGHSPFLPSPYNCYPMPCTSSLSSSKCPPILPCPPCPPPRPPPPSCPPPRIPSCPPPPPPRLPPCPPPAPPCPPSPGPPPILALPCPPCRRPSGPSSCPPLPPPQCPPSKPACPPPKPICPPPKPFCPPPKPSCPPPKPSCPPPKPSCPPPKPSCPPPKPSCPPPKPSCPPLKPSCPPPKPKCPPPKPKCPPKPKSPSKPKCPPPKPKCPKKTKNKCPPKTKKSSCIPKKCMKQSVCCRQKKKSPSFKPKKRCYRPKRKTNQQQKKGASRQQRNVILTDDIRFTDIIKFHCYNLYRRIVTWLQNLSQLGANALNFREFDPWIPIPFYEGPPAEPGPVRTEADPPIEIPSKPKLKPWYIHTPPAKDLPVKKGE